MSGKIKIRSMMAAFLFAIFVIFRIYNQEYSDYAVVKHIEHNRKEKLSKYFSNPDNINKMLPAGNWISNIFHRIVYGQEVWMRTPLSWSISYDRQELFDFLIESGAELNAPDSWGCLPTGDARIRLNRYYYDMLIEKGAHEISDEQIAFIPASDGSVIISAFPNYISKSVLQEIVDNMPENSTVEQVNEMLTRNDDGLIYNPFVEDNNSSDSLRDKKNRTYKIELSYF